MNCSASKYRPILGVLRFRSFSHVFYFVEVCAQLNNALFLLFYALEQLFLMLRGVLEYLSIVCISHSCNICNRCVKGLRLLGDGNSFLIIIVSCMSCIVFYSFYLSVLPYLSCVRQRISFVGKIYSKSLVHLVLFDISRIILLGYSFCMNDNIYMRMKYLYEAKKVSLREGFVRLATYISCNAQHVRLFFLDTYRSFRLKELLSTLGISSPCSYCTKCTVSSQC